MKFVCLLDFRSNKKMFDFSNYWTKSKCKSKYYDNSKNLVNDKMKNKIRDASIQEFVRLKQKLYSFLVDNKERKKAKGTKRNIVTTISHNEYKNVLLNNKRTRHSINRI